MAFWNETLRKARWVRREMSSSSLRWLRVEAIEQMHARSVSRCGEETESGGERVERYRRELALFKMLMAFSVGWEKAQ